MKLYKIRSWGELYENNRTRELKKLDWVPIPNKQDGDGYTIMVSGKDGAAIFGAWIACIQIASRCDPRGTLMRDCNKPHDSASLSRMSRIPVDVFEKMLIVASSADVGWLEVSEFAQLTDNPAPSCGNPAAGCLELKGMEMKELNGKNGGPASPPALNSEHAAFIKGWTDNYRTFFGWDYAFDGGKDGSAVKALLKLGILRLDLLEFAKQAWARSKANGSAWNCKKAATIHGYKSYFNEIRAELSASPKPESKQIQETINVPTL